jgi:hypothetical protein
MSTKHWRFFGNTGGEPARIEDQPMTNDAKLGLLVGVVGVVIASMMQVNRPPQPAAAAVASPTSPRNAAPKPTPEPKVTVKPTTAAPDSPVPAVLPGELTSTPVVRTKKDPDAVPAGRTTTKNDDE